MIDAVLHLHANTDVCLQAVHCYVTQHLLAVAWMWSV